jgi:hypothetical protein
LKHTDAPLLALAARVRQGATQLLCRQEV